MIKKILFLLVLLFFLPLPAYAQGNKDLTTCEEATYCEGNDLILKANCNYASQFQYCRRNPNECRGIAACNCTYDPVGECKAGQPVKQPWEDVVGTVNAPKQVRNLGFGAGGISTFLTNIIGLVYIVAGIVFIFMMVMGAFSWIVSGGDKEAIAKARLRIINAIIGLVLLALTFFILAVIGQVTGFKLFVGQPAT